MMSTNTVRALVDYQAKHHPQQNYLLSADSAQALRFDELAQSCAQVTAWLDSLQVAQGDTVSFVMPNGANTLRLLLGVMWGGRCVNPINLLSQPDQLRYVIEHSDCKLLIVSSEWEERVKQQCQQIGRSIAVVVADPERFVLESSTTAPRSVDANLPSVPSVPEESVALLMYTSGTTGVPKGVMLTQANLVANARAISKEHALGGADRVLAVLPLYHINAFTVTMLAPLASGGSVVTVSKFSAAKFWNQVSEASCTWINVVPTIISYLLEGSAPDRQSIKRVRFCRSASAALPPEHLLAFQEKFGIGVIETMGLTETAAPAFSNPLDPQQRKVGAVGRASGCEARIINAQLEAVPDHETGELAIRGPQVMLGYYKNPEATAASFTPDGWLRTGDLGHRDSDGFFFVTGRIKELIIKGGENIAPREIDEALLKHPGVLEAAAVGIPDKHYGQQILACVVPRSGADCSEQSLRAFCVEKLGPYKTPSVFRFVSELPRGPSGKVQRLKLLES